MTKKIESLTPVQERRLVEFREEMRTIGLRTGHDAECEKIGKGAILDAYREFGLGKPMILWAQSPLQAVIMGWALKTQLRIQLGDQLWNQLGCQLGDQLGDQLWGQLGCQLGDQLRNQLGGQLESQLGDQLGSQLGSQLENQLWNQLGCQLGDQLENQLGCQLGDQLENQLWNQLRNQLRNQLGDQLWSQLGSQLGDQLGEIYRNWWSFGQCEAYWIAWTMFGAEIGVKFTDATSRRLDIVRRIAQAAFMCFSWKELTILVHHPERISFDARKLLHAEDGMALRWSDGYGVSAWHGTRVPDEWLRDRGSLDPKVALTDPSVERRRAAAEIIGWARVMEAVPHRKVDIDPDPEIGTLISADLPDAPGSMFLQVRCGTGRTFVLPVPRECKTALEANAWTYDIKPLDLKKLEART